MAPRLESRVGVRFFSLNFACSAAAAVLLLFLECGGGDLTQAAVNGTAAGRDGGSRLWAPGRIAERENSTRDQPTLEPSQPPKLPKPPNIAAIRHHRSRKVFVRTTTARARLDNTGESAQSSTSESGYQSDGPSNANHTYFYGSRTANPNKTQDIRALKLLRNLPSNKTHPKENQLEGRLSGESLAINNAVSGGDDESGNPSWMQSDSNAQDGYQDGDDYEIIYTATNKLDPINNNHETNKQLDPSSYHDKLPTATETNIPRQPEDLDIVSKFLRFIEANTAENCTAGTDLKLGQGIVDRYAQERFRLEAELAVNRANMLTRIWKYSPSTMDSEYLLHAGVISLVEFDDDIFAGGNCYDRFEYKNYSLFCPFAHRLPEGRILVKDLAVEYKYLSDSSEFFYAARKNAERVIQNFRQFSRAYHLYPHNDSHHFPDRVLDEILNVTYEDGKWSEPYFDCGGGDIWMMTYTVPFFGYKNGSYFFKGTSGIDIDLRRVDIDQCYANEGELNLFANSNKCKNATTQCVPIKGLGFRRGSYKCECRRGFYFPNVTSTVKYFNGSVLEEEYENRFHAKLSVYDEVGAFECLPCPTDCETCEDDRPCVVTLNWVMRTAILILQSAIIGMLPIVGVFTWRYSEVKVVRAASPVLLRFIVLGAFFIYCTTLVMYPTPSLVTCTLRVWLREIGFSLAYGALMLKTWRISVIFRVRSAKAVKITDLDLMKRLGIIVAMFTALLVIRTLVSPPHSVVSYTAQDLKAWLCESDWWDHSFTIMELSLLVWGIRLCIVVRKAPSEFNESKFISLAIYNEFLLSLFLNISMLFLQSPANPDLLYIIFFCHVQLTMTLLLCLIFGSKAYMVFRGQDKTNTSDEPRVANSKFLSKSRSSGQSKHGHGQLPTSGYNSIVGGQMNHSNSHNLSNHVMVSEEFHRIYAQLEELKKQNLKLGEIALVGKIIAMQEAANKIIIQTTSAAKQQSLSPARSKESETHQQTLQVQLHQTLLVQPPSSNTLRVPENGDSNVSVVSGHCTDNLYTSAAILPGTGSTATSQQRKKSIVVLSNISEEELGAVGTALSPSTQVQTKDNNCTAASVEGEQMPAEASRSDSKLIPNSITDEMRSEVSSTSSNSKVQNASESGESCSESCSREVEPGSQQKHGQVAVQVLVSCHSQQQQQQHAYQPHDDMSPTSLPSENEVQVGDEVYMDAVEEEDGSGPPGHANVLAPRASEEHESDLDESCGHSRKSHSGSGKKTKKYYSKQDTIEFIDEGEDAIIVPTQETEATSSAAVQEDSKQRAKTKDEKKDKGKSDKDKKDAKVILDLDDKSRFTEEITV